MSDRESKLSEIRKRLKSLQNTPVEFDQLERAERVELARTSCEEAFRLYSHVEGRAEEESLWHEAALLFRKSVDEAYPDDFSDRFNELRRGESTGLEMAVRFLEIDPWFFRSGYVKANLIKFIIRIQLDADYVIRLQKVVLAAIDFRDRREFRWYCKLARKIYGRSLRQEVEQRLVSSDPSTCRRARWVLSAITHNATFHINRGRRQYSLGNFSDAVGDFTRAVLLEPGSARAFMWRGVAYARLRVFEKAVLNLTQALAVGSLKYAETFSCKFNGQHLFWTTSHRHVRTTYKWRGWIHAEEHRYREAASDFSEAIRISPKDSYAHRAHGRALLNLKDYEGAIDDLNQTILLQPSSAESYFLRGLAYMAQSHAELAMRDLEKALELNANDFSSLASLSEDYSLAHRYEDALKAANSAADLRPNSALAEYCRGRAFLGLKSYEEALSALNESIAIAPNRCDGESYFWRAKVFEALGALERADADRALAKSAGFANGDSRSWS